MIALIHLLLRKYKKEHLLLTRYEKAHPHFLWYLSIDAVLSIVLVIGGFQFAKIQSTSKVTSSSSVHADTKAMSASEFIHHLKGVGEDPYWLGPKAGYSYAHSSVSQGVTTVIYLKNGSADLFNFDKSELTIQTFDNAKPLATHLQASTEFDNVAAINSHGDSISFNSGSMMVETVGLKNSKCIIVITYPTQQSSQSMMKNAAVLRQVW